MFALAYMAIQVGRAAFAFVTLRHSLGVSHPLSRTFRRTLSWHLTAGVSWTTGGLLDGEARYVLWMFALTIAYGAAPRTGLPHAGLIPLRRAPGATPWPHRWS